MNFQVLGLSVKLTATPTCNWWCQATHESFSPRISYSSPICETFLSRYAVFCSNFVHADLQEEYLDPLKQLFMKKDLRFKVLCIVLTNAFLNILLCNSECGMELSDT